MQEVQTHYLKAILQPSQRALIAIDLDGAAADGFGAHSDPISRR